MSVRVTASSSQPRRLSRLHDAERLPDRSGPVWSLRLLARRMRRVPRSSRSSISATARRFSKLRSGMWRRYRGMSRISVGCSATSPTSGGRPQWGVRRRTIKPWADCVGPVRFVSFVRRSRRSCPAPGHGLEVLRRRRAMRGNDRRL